MKKPYKKKKRHKAQGGVEHKLPKETGKKLAEAMQKICQRKKPSEQEALHLSA